MAPCPAGPLLRKLKYVKHLFLFFFCRISREMKTGTREPPAPGQDKRPTCLSSSVTIKLFMIKQDSDVV